MVNSSFILLNSPLIPLPTPTRAPKAPAISLPTSTHSDSLSSPTFSARSAGSAVAPFFTDLTLTGSAKEHGFLVFWQRWHDRALELEDLNNKSVRRIRDDYTTTHLIGQKQSASAFFFFFFFFFFFLHLFFFFFFFFFFSFNWFILSTYIVQARVPIYRHAFHRAVNPAMSRGDFPSVS